MMKDVERRFQIPQFVYILDYTIRNVKLHYELYSQECKFALLIVQSKI